MMDTTNSIQRNNLGWYLRSGLDRSGERSILGQREMTAVPMVVLDVLTK